MVWGRGLYNLPTRNGLPIREDPSAQPNLEVSPMKSSSLLVSLVLGATLVGSASLALARENMSPTDEAIVTRQAGYKFMAWNMGKIKGNLAGSYNKEQVAAAANTINAIANSGMGALYPAGSDKAGAGVHTHVKPELFKQPEKVKELAIGLSKATNELARAAASGDAGAVKVAFGKTGEACKSCHDKFREKE